MIRQTFALVVWVVASLSTACTPDEPTTVTLIAVMPPDGAFGSAPQDLAHNVRLLTDGSLTIDVQSPAAGRIAVPRIFDLVDAGTIDLAVAPPAAFEVNGKTSPVGPLLVSGIPFGFKAHEFLAWYFGAGGEALVQSIYDRRSAHSNVVLMPLVVTASEPPGFFTEPVPSDADQFNASGLTYRINLLGAEVMAIAFPNLNLVSSPPGVVPVDALCEQRIQGAELGTLSVYERLFFEHFSHPNGDNIVDCGFEHLYLSSWQQPMLSNWLLINRAFLESLAPHEQDAIRLATKAQLTSSLASDLAASAGIVEKIRAAGATIHAALPDAVLQRLRAATLIMIEQKSALDEDFKLLTESMREFAVENHAGLLYDGVASDQRFSRMPGWRPDNEIVSD
ncbi:MAG: hypothetical protein AAGH76_04935 [Pseudomonadota bacterium]